MQTHPTSLSDDPSSALHPPCDVESIKERLKAASASIKIAALFAWDLDWLGDEATHAAGSQEQLLAELRDEVDTALSSLLLEIMTHSRWRAETSRSFDLLSLVVRMQRGNACDTLNLMDRLEELFGRESAADGDAGSETLPGVFAWDTYLRVSALADLAEKYPEHLRPSARQMDGWPMIVSPQLDCPSEFERIAEHLEGGAAHPQS